MVNTVAQECWVATGICRGLPSSAELTLTEESAKSAKMKLFPCFLNKPFASKHKMFCYAAVRMVMPRKSYFSSSVKASQLKDHVKCSWEIFRCGTEVFKCGVKIFKVIQPGGDDIESRLAQCRCKTNVTKISSRKNELRFLQKLESVHLATKRRNIAACRETSTFRDLKRRTFKRRSSISFQVGFCSNPHLWW